MLSSVSRRQHCQMIPSIDVCTCGPPPPPPPVVGRRGMGVNKQREPSPSHSMKEEGPCGLPWSIRGVSLSGTPSCASLLS